LLFAFSAKNINDVWAWIIMGLGGGMIFPQLLPLYWSRFNGIGYSVGTLTGLLAAVCLRWQGPNLPSSWSFVNTEYWYLMLLSLTGLLASVGGTLLSSATPEPVLRHFYLTTLPFGSWSRYRHLLPKSLQQKVSAEHRRDVAKAQPRLLLDGRRHALVRTDAELARADQDAMAGRDLDAVAVARERRADRLGGDVSHGGDAIPCRNR